jgi:hypothetical protein
MAEKEEGPDWQSVVARSAAFLALHGSGLREKDLATQGQFLERLGLPRRYAAELLGTTPASLTELMRLAKKKKGAPRGRSKAR